MPLSFAAPSFVGLFRFNTVEAAWYPMLLNAIWQAAVLAVVLMRNFVRRCCACIMYVHEYIV